MHWALCLSSWSNVALQELGFLILVLINICFVILFRRVRFLCFCCCFTLEDQSAAAVCSWARVLLIRFVANAAWSSTFVARCSWTNCCDEVGFWGSFVLINVLLVLWSELTWFAALFIVKVFNVFCQLELRNLILNSRIDYFSIVTSIVFQISYFLGGRVLIEFCVLLIKSRNQDRLLLALRNKTSRGNAVQLVTRSKSIGVLWFINSILFLFLWLILGIFQNVKCFSINYFWFKVIRLHWVDFDVSILFICKFSSLCTSIYSRVCP